MEQNNDNINNFETTLEHHKLRKRLTIYSENVQIPERYYTPTDVLSNISQQLRALQRADSINSLNSRFKVSRWKEGALQPANLLSLDSSNCQHSCQNVNKFETQGVSDTQLIQIAENVENLMVPVGMTQEFENSFCEQPTSGNQLIDKTFNNFTQENNEIKNDLNKKAVIKDPLYQNIYISAQNVSPHVEVTDDELLDTNNANDEPQDSIKLSPIINYNKLLTPDFHSPLIYTIEAFENFETIAFPIVEKNTDVEVAKQLIHSEINRKMLCFCNQTKPALNKKDSAQSSVPNINKMNFKMLPSHLTCEDVISKRTEKIEIESNKIFEDEILFSDDEGNSKEPPFRELPITCALETSSYNEHDNLDKTMLVGFQTASNKIIEIKTDSYHRAFSIVDKEDGNNLIPTLKKIVEIYDNGLINNMNEKGVDNNVDVNLSNKNSGKDCDIEMHDVNIMEIGTCSNKPNVPLKPETVSSETSVMIPEDTKKSKEFSINLKQDSLHTNVAKLGCDPVFQNIKCNQKYYKGESENRLCNTPLQFSQTFNEGNDASTNFDESKDFMEVYKHINLDDPTIIQDLENDLLCKDNKIHENELHKNVTKNQRQLVVDNNKNVETRNKEVEEINKEPLCIDLFSKANVMGFKTASNKQIIISKEALARTKNIFEDCNTLNDFDKDCKTRFNRHHTSVKTNFIDCHDVTAGKVVLSHKILQNSEVVIENKETENLQNLIEVENKAGHSTAKIFDDCGLKTPNNEPIIKTSEGLVKSTKILREIDSFGGNVLDFTCKFGNIANEGFERTHHKIDTVSREENGKPKGLSDVNNKQVVECSLKNSSINGLHNDHGNDDFVSVPKNHKLRNGKNFHVNANHDFKGFQIISGKNEFISKEVVDKCTNILQDFEDDEELYKMCSDFGNKELITNARICKMTSKSSTSNNPDVEIRNDNSDLNKHNTVLDKNNLSNEVFKGFQTASKKKIKISDEALAKSKQIFMDLEFNENEQRIKKHEKENPDMSTVVKCELQNDNTKLIMGGLKKRVADFHHCANEPPTDDHNFKNDQPLHFRGFQTASKKVIKISEKALANSKKIFQDLDLINEEPNQENFKCVAGEQFKITQALDNNKKLDQNLDRDRTNYKLNYDDSSNSKIIEPQSVDNKNLEEKSTTKRCGLFDNSNLRNNRIVFESGFIGFQTGNNKRVKISDDALAESKKIFQDLNLNEDYKQRVNSNNHFKDKNSLNSNFSESENILKAKMYSIEDGLRFEIENNKIEGCVQNYKNNNLPLGELEEKYEGNLKNILDTQVLNNFEETLCTEDFCNEITPIKSKRSGSPILCPRVKKRKEFKVPFRSDRNQKSEPKNIVSKKNISIAFAFDNNFKKIKKMSLTDLKNMEKLNEGIFEEDLYISSFKFDNLLDFSFSGKRNELSEDTWSTEDVKKCFLSLVKNKIVPDGWLDNHLKLIIFKLIYYETEFKNVMQGVCSVRNVLEQLKYRYDKELYNVERPAFRKLLEKDDVSTKTMVLRVVAIYVEGVAVSSTTDTDDVELLLTDGWYCIRACLDPMLRKLVCSRKIQIGTKLATHGAELLNCEQGIAPWENTSSVRLKLSGNSTRRARWDARLGYHSAAAILTPLSCVALDGGKVSKLRVFVTRVYPTLYVEKFENGSTVTRSERLEHLHQIKYESETQALLERLYEEVEKEFMDKESQNSESDNDVGRSLESGSQINRLMKQSKDPGEFIEYLTNTQCVMLQDYTSRRREKLLQSMQARLAEKLKAMGLHNGRNVVPVLKIRIADVSANDEVTKASMSIWRPNESVLDVIKEGTWIEVFNTAPTAVRYSEIQLSASKRTIFKRSNHRQCENINKITLKLERTCYSTKELVQNQSKHTHYNEIDTVGLVFLIDPSNDRFESIKGQLFQNVYLTDAEKNMVCVNFWGGLRKFGYENILDTGQVVAAMNLQKRLGNTRKSILQFRATEYSYFTKTSKLASVRRLAEDLNKALTCIDIKKLCEECKAMKNDSLFKNNGENISPYRFDYSAYNVSKHGAFVDSPLTRKPNQVNNILNHSGLDFESNFKKVDTPDMLISTLTKKKTVKEKIAKLEMYGEPPPLNCIHIINKSNVTSAFKSPLSINNNISDNVTSKPLKVNPNKLDNVFSPVITNPKNTEKRKSGNPVKLNFYDAPCGDSDVNVVDPFAEEFDASLPLSLDYNSK